MKQDTGDYSVFVGNLPFKITASELVALAATFGRTAGCNIPVDRTSNKSLGYGFVYTKYASDADRIATGLNGYMLDGRKLRASIGRARGSRARPTVVLSDALGPLLQRLTRRLNSRRAAVVTRRLSRAYQICKQVVDFSRFKPC